MFYGMRRHLHQALNLTLLSVPDTQSHPNLTVAGLCSVMGLCDDMLLWSIRGIPAWDIYGAASLSSPTHNSHTL